MQNSLVLSFKFCPVFPFGFRHPFHFVLWVFFVTICFCDLLFYVPFCVPLLFLLLSSTFKFVLVFHFAFTLFFVLCSLSDSLMRSSFCSLLRSCNHFVFPCVFRFALSFVFLCINFCVLFCVPPWCSFFSAFHPVLHFELGNHFEMRSLLHFLLPSALLSRVLSVVRSILHPRLSSLSQYFLRSLLRPIWHSVLHCRAFASFVLLYSFAFTLHSFLRSLLRSAISSVCVPFLCFPFPVSSAFLFLLPTRSVLCSLLRSLLHSHLFFVYSVPFAHVSTSVPFWVLF